MARKFEGGAPPAAGQEPVPAKDFTAALEDMPEEVAMEEGSGELDAEQADIASQLKLDGTLLKRFIESVIG